MTLQALAHLIVDTVLISLDRHTFASIPAADIQAAVRAVAQVLRDESAALCEPESEGS